MAALTYNRIRLNMSSPWDYGRQQPQLWSCNFVLSGAAPMTVFSDVETTALDLWTPISGLTQADTNLVGWSYYPPNSHSSTFAQTYAAGVHGGTGNGLVTSTKQQQGEVCILCEGPTDKNSRGKQVYLRKWIHNVTCATGNQNQRPALVGDPVAKWKTGSGPNLLVPIDPDSGMQASTWTVKTHLYTRQFRKGKKRKVVTTYVPVPIP